MFHALYHTPVTILRLYMVYGPGQQDLRKLVPYVTLALLKGEMPRVSSGVREVDRIYVDDVAAGYLAAATATGVEGEHH
jgi:nucleoside-diphosphate-sugar epimerase